MMKGYLTSKGIHAGEGRIGRFLREINPRFHEERRQVGSGTVIEILPIQEELRQEIQRLGV